MTPYAKLASCRVYVLDDRAVQLSVWRELDGSDEIAVLEHGSPAEANDVATVRIHSACFTGDVLASLRCDCNAQLQTSLNVVVSSPWGVMIYPFAHEGRGIGLVNKMRAYNKQDEGLDTFQANRALGFDSDQRNYDGVVSVLRAIGVRRVRLLTANPQKVRVLKQAGIGVLETIPITVAHNTFNTRYLKTKEAWFHQDETVIARQTLLRADENTGDRGRER